MASQAPLLCIVFLFTAFHLISTSTETTTYIIHMDLSVMPTAFAGHRHWYSATLSAAAGAATQEASDPASPKLVYAYDHVINGFSAALSPSQLEAIEKSHGFLSAYPDMPITLETTRTPEFLHLNPVSGIWPASDFGKDIIIGVIDTGVWPESESYRDDGMGQIPARWKGACVAGTAFNSSMCNRKLIGARYFNKGLIANKKVNISMNSARDTNGHGTHVASTAAGNNVKVASFFDYASGSATGIAPRASVAVYKVIFDEGGWGSDTLAAMDQAIADGVDILSMSISSSPTPLYRDLKAIGSFAAVEKGILVVLAAGNYGPSALTIRNAAPWQLTVGSTTIDRKFFGSVTLGNGTTIIGDSLFPGNSSLLNVPLVYRQNVKDCDSVTVLNSVGNKVVVCEGQGDLDGTNLKTQFSRVSQSRVAGGIFLSSRFELRSTRQFTFPAVIVTAKDFATISEYASQSSDPRVSLNFRQTSVGIKPAPYIVVSSSRGPSRICPTLVKPDLVAPGSLVLAAYPTNRPAAAIGSNSLHNNFILMTGTSMATPHVSGVAAMLKSIHPDWSPAAIRSAMMTTAIVVDNTLNPIKDSAFGYKNASPLHMGAGLIDPNKAVDPGLVYDAGVTDYAMFLCSLNYTRNQIQTITRSSTYPSCSNTNFDLNYPSFIAYFDPNNPSFSTVKVFQRTVTNVGDAASIYTAKLTSIQGITVSVIPDKLVFMNKYEKLNFTLTLRLSSSMVDYDVHGYLSWVDNGARHVVRSPIVAVKQFPS